MSKELRVDVNEINKALSTEAQSIRQTISSGGIPKITISRTGSFTSPEGDLGTEISGVIIDYCSSNKFYPHAYNANNPLPPVCFAFGKVVADMAPLDESPEKQHEDCATCPRNEWGSALNGGKGKACKNTRELAFVLEEDLDDPDATIYLVSVSPTAIKSFDAVANQISRTLDGPPIKAIITIKAVPAGTFTTMVFQAKEANPNYAAHFAMREEAQALITQVPDTTNYVPSTQRPASGTPAARRPAR
jgi:hypothetical protein